MRFLCFLTMKKTLAAVSYAGPSATLRVGDVNIHLPGVICISVSGSLNMISIGMTFWF